MIRAPLVTPEYSVQSTRNISLLRENASRECSSNDNRLEDKKKEKREMKVNYRRFLAGNRTRALAKLSCSLKRCVGGK